MDELATVIFSSGSTGDPKGVMLTHFNIASNISQVIAGFHARRTRQDSRHPAVLSLLRIHGRALAARGAWRRRRLPSQSARCAGDRRAGREVQSHVPRRHADIPAGLHAPLHARELWLACNMCWSGAEKLPERVALAFEDQFGIRPLEGYGCTECSPVVTVNGKDFRAPGFRQVAARRGKIGHPLPGVSVKVVDIDTGAAGGSGNCGNAAGERAERDARLPGQARKDSRSAARWLVHHRRRRE